MYTSQLSCQSAIWLLHSGWKSARSRLNRNLKNRRLVAEPGQILYRYIITQYDVFGSGGHKMTRTIMLILSQRRYIKVYQGAGSDCKEQHVSFAKLEQSLPERNQCETPYFLLLPRLTQRKLP